MVETSTPDTSTAVLSLPVAANADDVFTAFTDPAGLAAWHWPESYAAQYETDPRPGGQFIFRSTGLPSGKNVAVRGIYGEIRPPWLLNFIWAWDGDFSPFTQVGVEIRPHPSGSEIVVTQSENVSEEQRDEHLKNWNDRLTRLAEHLGMG